MLRKRTRSKAGSHLHALAHSLLTGTGLQPELRFSSSASRHSSFRTVAMAALALLLLALAVVGGTDAAWCVCKSGLNETALQKTLDYACGAGADCSPIIQNGACYNPNTVNSHCSYAVNSFYQRKGQAQGACDFSGTATLTTTDPSYTGCTYPATASSAGTSSTPVTSTPGTLSPPNGVFGGLGPSSNLPDNSGSFLLSAGLAASLLLIGVCSWMALLS